MSVLRMWRWRGWHFSLPLIGLAIFDAPIAAGVARISLATIAAVGFILVLYLSTHGYDRAVMLIPTWFLLLVWVVAAGFTVTWLTHQRSCVSRADWWSGPDRNADRLHGDAERPLPEVASAMAQSTIPSAKP